MGSSIIICDQEDIKEIEQSSQLEFIFGILDSSGIPDNEINLCRPDENGFSVYQKIQLRNLCKQYGITILNDSDGTLRIYVETILESNQSKKQNLIAEWKKPWYILRKDNNVKKYYAEIHCSWWIEQEEQNG